MSTTVNNWAPAPQKEALPPLVKQSSTYKMIVPAKVEKKIRYLIRKFPHTEWSGVLFIKHTGSFDTNDLVITCEDLYPMDLGTSGWTEFKMTEDVTAYIASNLDLFECDLALCHSHHSLGAFFSGQDIKTLNVEGNDTNCFVSLIVDTKGTYQAAITRKIQKKTEVVTKSLGTSYQFFGEGSVVTDEDPMSESTQVIDKEVIEYFMLDVEVEEVDNPLAYLDVRFDEIEAKKKADAPFPNLGYTRVYDPKKGDTTLVPSKSYEEEDKEFYSWIHSERNKAGETKEATLFDENTMDELIDVTKWQPDPEVIQHLVTQLITCSLIVSQDIDLKQWITKHMTKKYNEIFGFEDNAEFDSWADSYVEFIVNHYSDENTPAEVYDDWDNYQGKIAEAIADKLCEYPGNGYIDQYVNVLGRYLCELAS